MRITSLGSGSSGNAFLIQSATTSVLIDCGVGVRTCVSALRSFVPTGRLDAIVVSHEHSDHVRSLAALLHRHACPVAMTRGTRRMLHVETACTEVTPGGRFREGDIEVTFIAVAHDAAEPCGFVVECSGRSAAIFTDLGHVTPGVAEALRAADTIVLEANYDPSMLRAGRYPAHLKRRIASPHGHLSNDDCATALATFAARADTIWLAHLSENNNHPRVAETAVTESLRMRGIATAARPLPRSAPQVLDARPESPVQERLPL